MVWDRACHDWMTGGSGAAIGYGVWVSLVSSPHLAPSPTG